MNREKRRGNALNSVATHCISINRSCYRYFYFQTFCGLTFNGGFNFFIRTFPSSNWCPVSIQVIEKRKHKISCNFIVRLRNTKPIYKHNLSGLTREIQPAYVRRKLTSFRLSKLCGLEITHLQRVGSTR